MQEVRRHTIKVLRPLVSNKFQVLFHSPNRGSFHLSLTVLFAIGRYRVFSLMPWSAHIHTTFRVCGATLEFPRVDQIFEYKTFTFFGSSFQRILLIIAIPCWSPNPDLINQFGLGWSLFARHYWGNRFAFFSSAYLDVSVQRVCFSYLCIQYKIPSKLGGFSHSEIPGSKLVNSSPRLIAVSHVLHRLISPRHPLIALSNLAV